MTIPTRLPPLSMTGKPLMCRSSMMRTASRTVLSGAIDTTGDVMMSLTFMAILHSLCGHRRPCPPFFLDPYQPRHDIRRALGIKDIRRKRKPARDAGRMAWILREDWRAGWCDIRLFSVVREF